MCLRPIRQKSNSRYFSVHNYSKMLLEYPCGECAECKQAKRNEHYLRSYWQVRATHDQDGYVLFDTLTYDEQHVPHASDFFSCVPKEKDFTCFNPEHYKSFMDKLKKRLERRGYDVRHNMAYDYVTEYGTSDTYTDPSGRVHKGTHRPHYHILLYVVGENKPDPAVLSDIISDCWTYGRTDGIRYRDRSYFNHNVFWKTCGQYRMNGLTMYISKYITKDSDFQKVLDSRTKAIIPSQMENKSLIAQITKKFHEQKSKYKWYKKENVREEKLKYFIESEVRKYVTHRIDQFHRHSLHFGMYAIEGKNLDLELLMKDGTMRIPDKDKVYKFIPIPMYYSRKLFYEKCRRNDGTEYWKPNELGKSYLRKRSYANVVRLADKCGDFMKSLNSYFEGEEYHTHVSKITKLLNGRSWIDYATYLVFFKGRLYDPTEDIDDEDTIIRKSLEVDQSGNGATFSLQELSDSDEAMLLSQCVMDESVSPKFKDFDRLFGYMDFLMDVSRRKKKQRLFDKKEYLEKKYKALGLKVHYKM